VPIETKNIALFEPRLPNMLDALGTQVWVELRFIDVKSWRKPDERGCQKSSDESGGEDDRHLPRNFPSQHR